MTGIIVDIIIVALIILSTFFGYKKGLTGVILKIFSFLIFVCNTFLSLFQIFFYIDTSLLWC